jgi:hypothetical protein
MGRDLARSVGRGKGLVNDECAPELGQLCLDLNLFVISVLTGGTDEKGAYSSYSLAPPSAPASRPLTLLGWSKPPGVRQELVKPSRLLQTQSSICVHEGEPLCIAALAWLASVGCRRSLQVRVLFCSSTSSRTYGSPHFPL